MTGHQCGPHDPANTPATITVLGPGKNPREHEEPLPKALAEQRRVLNELARAT